MIVATSVAQNQAPELPPSSLFYVSKHTMGSTHDNGLEFKTYEASQKRTWRKSIVKVLQCALVINDTVAVKQQLPVLLLNLTDCLFQFVTFCTGGLRDNEGSRLASLTIDSIQLRSISSSFWSKSAMLLPFLIGCNCPCESTSLDGAMDCQLGGGMDCKPWTRTFPVMTAVSNKQATREAETLVMRSNPSVQSGAGSQAKDHKYQWRLM